MLIEDLSIEWSLLVIFIVCSNFSLHSLLPDWTMLNSLFIASSISCMHTCYGMGGTSLEFALHVGLSGHMPPENHGVLIADQIKFRGCG